MNWLSVLKCGEDPLDRQAKGRVLHDFDAILWWASVKVKKVRGVGAHQSYCRERVEAIEYEISVGLLQIVAGHGERGPERPFLLADPYRDCSSRSSSKTLGNNWVRTDTVRPTRVTRRT